MDLWRGWGWGLVEICVTWIFGGIGVVGGQHAGTGDGDGPRPCGQPEASCCPSWGFDGGREQRSVHWRRCLHRPRSLTVSSNVTSNKLFVCSSLFAFRRMLLVTFLALCVLCCLCHSGRTRKRPRSEALDLVGWVAVNQDGQACLTRALRARTALVGVCVRGCAVARFRVGLCSWLSGPAAPVSCGVAAACRGVAWRPQTQEERDMTVTVTQICVRAHQQPEMYSMTSR